jgi:hypothetical protein
MFPTVYYIPQNIQPHDQRGHMSAMHYMPGVIYQPMMYPHPSFYQTQFQPTISSQLNLNDPIYTSAFQHERNIANPILQQKVPTPIGSGSQFENTVFHRPPSQATSVKADMGSTSASVLNRV